MSCFTVLEDKGYRLTPQRKVILDILHGNDNHLTAEDVFSQVEAKIPGVNKSTVYRTLELLESLGLVVKNEIGGQHIFHHSEGGHHHHLICRQCERIIDCDENLLSSLESTLLKEHDFQAELHHHVIYGVCHACRRKG